MSFGAFKSVVVESTGLTEKDERKPIYGASEDWSDGTKHEGLGTLFPSNDRSREIGIVDLTSLDRYVEDNSIERIDGIKLDIEGAELSALKGAKNTIARLRPWMVIEIGKSTCASAGYCGEDILRFLQPY